MAIGGAEDREHDCVILREFMRYAGGAKARIAVIATAVDPADEAALRLRYRTLFRGLGARTVDVICVSNRCDAQSEHNAKIIAQMTGIFFTGGNQVHITAQIGGSILHKAIIDRWMRGIVIAGTSAGAAMMSNSMLIGGRQKEYPSSQAALLGPGMGILSKIVVIDTHFFDRGRIGRPVMAVGYYPQRIALGIDEDTAAVFDGDVMTVIGKGSIIVVDGRDIDYSNIGYVDADKPVTLTDIRLHILAAGSTYNLKNHQATGPIIFPAHI